MGLTKNILYVKKLHFKAAKVTFLAWNTYNVKTCFRNNTIATKNEKD